MKAFQVRFLFFLLCSIFSFTAYGQELKVSGTVLDTEDKSPLIGAYVQLTSETDPTSKQLTTSDQEGKFYFKNILEGNYQVLVRYVGYQDFTKSIKINPELPELGTFELSPSVKMLQETQVSAQAVKVEQKGDTLQFNANAYKTNPDASAEDLLEKMPGMINQNGKMQAQGEEVKKVLVDGKPFFGDDPQLALKNMPAEAIEKIEVFDELSEQSQFTGFDDGNTNKTINIVTKPGMKNGTFGKAYAGYGTDTRYSAGGNVNIFKDEQRISILGMSNNVNQQNFTTEDLMGVASGNGGRRGGRGRRGRGMGGFSAGASVNDFMVGAQSGITSTHAFGMNYSDEWGEKLKVNGSYFFNRSDNEGNQFLNREYLLNEQTSQLYTENNQSENTLMNHRFNFKLAYEMDENNSFILRPKLSLQNSEAGSLLNSSRFTGNGDALNEAENTYNLQGAAFNFTNSLLWRHKFRKRGRTFSIGFDTKLGQQFSEDHLTAINLSYTAPELKTDSLLQPSSFLSDNYSMSANLVYTEPVSRFGQLMIRYNSGFSYGLSDKETYTLSGPNQELQSLDTALTNVFQNDYLTNELSTGLRLRKDKLMVAAGLSVQRLDLFNKETFPLQMQMDRVYHNLLPHAMLNYRFSKSSKLRVFYRSQTSAPNVNQLQNVIDNSNPQLLSMGNPELDQEYSHMLVSRFNTTNSEKNTTFFGMLYLKKTNNYIGNETFIAQQDSVLSDGILVQKGAQLSRPTNLEGYWNGRAFVSYGMPITFLKSNLNLNGGLNYIRTPGLINGEINFSNTTGMNSGFALSSNISEKVDFTLSYSATYNLVENTLQPEMNYNYLSQNARLKFNWIIWKGIAWNNELNHYAYSGISEALDQNYTLWNMSIGKKLLKEDKGEIKLSAFDLLGQNNSISRNVTGSYIEDVQSQVLTRYFLLSFSYKL